MVRQFLSTVLGKSVRGAMRLRGGGSALPGLVVEKIDPTYIARSLGQLPQGVVLISGTNGKTTTTKMVVELLEGQGLSVFTNRTGSNFTRGVVAALLREVTWTGKLKADIAVLELDEAHAVHFARVVPPTHSLLLNVMRDQLDRFGEIDHTAALLETIAKATTKSVTLNREDAYIRNIAGKLSDEISVSYFGLAPELLTLFPNDESLHDQTNVAVSTIPADVELVAFHDHMATFAFDGSNHSTDLQINGIYNMFNAAAAIACVRHILGDAVNTMALMASLSAVRPAFGRGETIMLDGQPVELVLVKNPGGFRLGLSSFSPEKYATMIAINDNYADGRDMSWLWDVSFESLRNNQREFFIYLSGIRAFDMALRLQYDDVSFKSVETDISKALHGFLTENSDRPKRIYCAYTAMLTIRKALSNYTKVRGIGV
ncbi:Mur ligase family protein [Candidatus Saccharibacteria bacterium]|nr:Mur ligase family protein [Candidatus Saccharibacteria bacterium]